ncbi:MAG: phospholipase D family protein [Nitrososphaerales archaeon]
MQVYLEDVSCFFGAAMPTLSLRFKVEPETPTTLELRMQGLFFNIHTDDSQMKKQVFLGSGFIPTEYRLPHTLTVHFELGYVKLNAIEEVRVKDVVLRVEGQVFYRQVFGSRIVQYGNAEDNKFEYYSYQCSKKIAESDWIEWLKTWGKDIQEVLLPASLVKELEALDLKGRDLGETISKLIERRTFLESSLEQLKVAMPTEFVCTEPTRKLLKEKAINMLDKAQTNEVIRITGYLGSPLLDRIFKLIERGCQIKLITRPLSGLDKESRDATVRLANLNREFVRVHDTVHARLLILGNREAIISSADLKSDSLDTNYESGIWVNNPVIINEVIQFFDRIWDEAGRWSG